MLEIEKKSWIPKENHFVGLLFDEGYWFVQILRRQQLTVYAPYPFNSGVAIAAGSTSGWETPTDTAGRRYLEPQEEETLYQFFTGLAMSTAKMYLQYTQRVDRMNLITPRTVPGNIGYWEGLSTPYQDPSPRTEIWSLYQLYPHFNVENPPVVGADANIFASFYITPYTYRVVKDLNKCLTFLKGEKPATIRTMGDGDRPIGAPAWLKSEYGDYLVCPEDIPEV